MNPGQCGFVANTLHKQIHNKSKRRSLGTNDGAVHGCEMIRKPLLHNIIIILRRLWGRLAMTLTTVRDRRRWASRKRIKMHACAPRTCDVCIARRSYASGARCCRRWHLGNFLDPSMTPRRRAFGHTPCQCCSSARHARNDRKTDRVRRCCSGRGFKPKFHGRNILVTSSWQMLRGISGLVAKKSDVSDMLRACYPDVSDFQAISTCQDGLAWR